tara:strand:+ start:1286 stop:2128 length:843 start_codon:yes stop_codon:yes gene_type:complete
MPTRRDVSEIKSKLLRPALTSDYEVRIELPLANAGVPKFRTTEDQSKLYLQCCSASLPGSSLATYDINNDRHGVTERHAYRRVYDDRIDLEFYVDADNYYPIRFFESWLGYIMDQEDRAESKSTTGVPNSGAVSNQSSGANARSKNYFYRSRFFDEYVASMTVTKFERDHRQSLTYTFLQAYPFSISSMPISYETSGLLKCTVGFKYVRYLIDAERAVETGEKEKDKKIPKPKTTPDPNPTPSKDTNEYYNNFGDNTQNSTNFADFTDGSNTGAFGQAIA